MRAAPSARVPISRQLYWGAVFGLLLTASLLSLAVYLFSADWLKTAGTLPVALHSGLRADYSADLRGLRPLAFSLGLVGEAARDQKPGAQDPLPGLAVLLQTPVATATPNATGQPGRPTLAAASPTPQPPSQASATAVTPTGAPASAVPTASATPTATFSPTASATRPTTAPTLATELPTFTPRPPTATQPPPTKVPPTKPLPTRTPTNPPPTRTPTLPPPPTAYPPPATSVPTAYPYP